MDPDVKSINKEHIVRAVYEDIADRNKVTRVIPVVEDMLLCSWEVSRKVGGRRGD
jgi:hypothetical protein